MTRQQRLAPDDWRRLEELWDAASELPLNQRADMLRAHGVDGALREELESLLDRANSADVFFDRLRAVVADTAQTAAQAADRSTPTPDDATPRLGADPMIGSTVGHYEILERLGQGGMGVVYRATDLRLRRTVALKLLRAQIPPDVRAKERLLGEARAAAALDNTNICTIYEVGETAEQLSFIAMAFYPGETLEHVLRRGPLPLATAIDYATQIARGLGAAHQRGVIHRDVKPANIIVTENGVLKLLDFGIARMLDVAVSQDGVTPGTIAYMSPEQVTSRALDRRSDLWSLGVVLYEMCTGVRPFGGEHAGAILYAILHESPPEPSTLRGDFSPQLESIIDRLLSKKPASRYGDAETLISDLISISDAPRVEILKPSTWWPKIRSRRRAARLGVAVLALLAVAVAWPSAHGPAVSERRMAAQDLYAQGHRDVLFRTDSGRREALSFFRQAIAVDSTYSAAHAALAHVLVLSSDNAGDSRRTQLREAEVAARSAIRLDSLLADGHAALGHVLLFDYQLGAAEAAFKRAVDLDPKTPYVREFLVWLYIFMDRPRDALEQAKRGAAENPDSPTAIAEEARALLVNGRCNEALPLIDRLMYLQPPPARAGAIAAQCYAQQAMWPKAVAAVRPVAERTPLQGNPWLGFMLARAGETERGRQIRDTLLEQSRRGEGGAYGVAVAYAGLREFDEAFAWLDKAIDDRSLRYNIMEPAFEDLRRDPRFDRLRERLGIQR